MRKIINSTRMKKSTKCRKIGVEKGADKNDRRKMRGVRKNGVKMGGDKKWRTN